MAECERLPDSREYIQRATDSAAAGDFAEARRQCLDILQTNPRDGDAFHILGAVSSCEGDLEGADEFLRRAIALEPQNAAWLRDLGILRIAAADWPGALRFRTRAIPPLRAFPRWITSSRTDGPASPGRKSSTLSGRTGWTQATWYTSRRRPYLSYGLCPLIGQVASFGFFQRPAKLNPGLWDTIAEILKQVENSRLLVHHASADLDSKTSASQLRLVAELESRGIDPGRARFRGLVPPDAHMRLLSTVDIALDSFPYTGQTTTCECLWMGVPVVTLAGNIHVSRASAGLLLRVGLGDMVARDIEEYVRIARRAASDLTALAALRRGLRRRVRESTLVDGARFAREVEEAYLWMWQQRIKTSALGLRRCTRGL
jgi:tetratricopeptide (TPR) repeat protein